MVLPERMADEGVALESSFRNGVKNEVLRSLCQLVNTNELALEVSLPSFVAPWACSWTICSDTSLQIGALVHVYRPSFWCCYAHVLCIDLLDRRQMQLLS